MYTARFWKMCVCVCVCVCVGIKTLNLKKGGWLNCVYRYINLSKYKVVQIWPGLFVCKQVTVCPSHIWTTLYIIVTTRSVRTHSNLPQNRLYGGVLLPQYRLWESVLFCYNTKNYITTCNYVYRPVTVNTVWWCICVWHYGMLCMCLSVSQNTL